MFYGSQTGTAEEFSARLAKEANRHGLPAMTFDPEECTDWVSLNLLLSSEVTEYHTGHVISLASFPGHPRGLGTRLVISPVMTLVVAKLVASIVSVVPSYEPEKETINGVAADEVGQAQSVRPQKNLVNGYYTSVAS